MLALFYRMNQIMGIAIGGVVLLGFIAAMVLFMIRPKNFGEYKEFFGERKY